MVIRVKLNRLDAITQIAPEFMHITRTGEASRHPNYGNL
jgi:hypothetical protein